LGDEGRLDEAVTTGNEAVEIWRDLATDRPDAFRPVLSMALNNLSLHLVRGGRQEQGLAAIEEAVRIRRVLVSSNPDRFRRDLANSLTNLSDALASMGRQAEALTPIREAGAIRRELTEHGPSLEVLGRVVNPLIRYLVEKLKAPQSLVTSIERLARATKMDPDSVRRSLAALADDNDFRVVRSDGAQEQNVSPETLADHARFRILIDWAALIDNRIDPGTNIHPAA
jgi:tetratricopeptide (TPR) repeat protein